MRLLQWAALRRDREHSMFPFPHSYTPHSKIPTPWGFLDPNIHLQRRHRESGSQDPVKYIQGKMSGPAKHYFIN